MAPLRPLAERSGVVLTMGVGLTSLTQLHLAEELAGRALFIRWANDRSGQVVGVRTDGCSEGFGRLGGVLESMATQCLVGTSVWTSYPASMTLEAASRAIREQPRSTHCERAGCDRCNDAVLGGPV